MRVLFICSGNNSAGINPIIERQGNSLIKKGFETSFFLIKGKGFFGYLKAVPQLKAYLKSNKFDVLHAHYALSGYVAFLGGGKHKRVLSFMGSDLLSGPREGGKISFFLRVFNKLNVLMAKFFFDAIILKSEEMMSAFGSSEKKVLIPNGVDINVFKQLDKKAAMNELRFDESKHHIIFVSNPERREKNYRLAEKAFDLLDKSKYDLHIVFNKETSHLLNYYNAADVVLLTSFHEGSPNVIKEAMACGCPVVTTNTGDVSLLLESVDGCFVTNFDPEGIRDCIVEAAEFRKKNNFTRGREKLRELKLSADEIAERLIELYKSLGRA